MRKYPLLILGSVSLVLGAISHLWFLIVVALSLFITHYVGTRDRKQQLRQQEQQRQLAWQRQQQREQERQRQEYLVEQERQRQERERQEQERQRKLTDEDNAPVGERNPRAIPQNVLMAVMARDRGLCRYCGRPGEEVDHIIPWSQGGANTIRNLVCSCKECNRSKGANVWQPKPLSEILNMSWNAGNGVSA